MDVFISIVFFFTGFAFGMYVVTQITFDNCDQDLKAHKKEIKRLREFEDRFNNKYVNK